MKPERYEVFVDLKADRKLAAHIEFLARVSEKAAVRLYGLYEESLLALQESPASCPVYPFQKAVDAELRYRLFGKRYRMIFEIAGNAVFVYDIQDCRQDFDKSLV